MGWITIPAKVKDEPGHFVIKIKHLQVEAVGLDRETALKKFTEKISKSMKYPFPNGSFKLICQENGKWILWSKKWELLRDRALELSPLSECDIKEERKERVKKANHLTVQGKSN